jgi:amidase
MTELAGFVTTAVLSRGYSYLGGFPVNPSDPEKSPGGSSNGSAIAVKAGMCDAGLGTETRGSVMIPALACGVYAFKPTRGCISRRGIIPLSSLLDAPGVLARSPEALEAVLAALCRADPRDCAPLTGPERETPSAVKLKRHRIGLLETEGTPDAPERLLRAEDLLKRLGFETVRIPAENRDFAYKKIASEDFLLSMDRFLAPLRAQLGFGSASELIALYRRDPAARPYGFDRLTDAEGFPRVTEDELRKFAAPRAEDAADTVLTLLSKYRCGFLASVSFIDYWSLSGAPSAVLPIGADGAELNLMTGAAPGEDRALLALIKEISGRLKASGG